MAREQVILECTEARALGKPPSRYFTTKKKVTGQQPRLELKKYNPFLRRHTLHREVR
ncbi:50S ribosomal protein L33 [Candidatus Methylacidithermus pantelleriae]|uniref:Large ribosomal subunit protein bL33 n=1 Tax=Candidatus Methylacidithermus pantelleriae TaxID=2744239 RepID=A0A8J2BMM8_9BACT|nr:50S ribosomal protein L33 [Candidatus Methylacidithermus pantelleriae]CAF0693026.1 50S ribosomal protein L33 [Candidatus Methylacidithermus pantelleriae]